MEPRKLYVLKQAVILRREKCKDNMTRFSYSSVSCSHLKVDIVHPHVGPANKILEKRFLNVFEWKLVWVEFALNVEGIHGWRVFPGVVPTEQAIHFEHVWVHVDHRFVWDCNYFSFLLLRINSDLDVAAIDEINSVIKNLEVVPGIPFEQNLNRINFTTRIPEVEYFERSVEQLLEGKLERAQLHFLSWVAIEIILAWIPAELEFIENNHLFFTIANRFAGVTFEVKEMEGITLDAKVGGHW